MTKTAKQILLDWTARLHGEGDSFDVVEEMHSHGLIDTAAVLRWKCNSSDVLSLPNAPSEEFRAKVDATNRQAILKVLETNQTQIESKLREAAEIAA